MSHPLLSYCPEESYWFSIGIGKDASGYSVSARQACEDFAWALISKWRRLCLCFSSSHTGTIYPSIHWQLLIHALIITLQESVCINMLSSHLPLPYSLLPEVYLGFLTVYMISGILLPEPLDTCLVLRHKKCRWASISPNVRLESQDFRRQHHPHGMQFQGSSLGLGKEALLFRTLTSVITINNT